MRRIAAILSLLLLVLAACQNNTTEITATLETIPAETATDPATPTPDITATPRPFLTPRATLEPEIATETATATLTSAPTRARTETPTRTVSPTLTSTSTPTPTATATDTATFTPTLTATPSLTPLPTATPTIIRTPAALLPFGANFMYTTYGASIELIDLSGGDIESWLWDFGDGNTSGSTDVRHYYTRGGRYVITLTIRSAEGLSTALRAVDITPHTCVLSPIGYARVYRQPDLNSQAFFVHVEGQHLLTTSRAAYGADGIVWYEADTGGWLSSALYRPHSGQCPEPPPQE